MGPAGMWSAAELRAVPLEEPGRIFSEPRLEVVEREYRALARIWHPDAGGSPDVFLHLGRLREAAEAQVNHRCWDSGTRLLVEAPGERPLHIHYRRRSPFELGQAFLCHQALVFLLGASAADFEAQALALARALPFPDGAMRRAYEDRLPKVRRRLVLEDGRSLLVVEKAPELLRLRDLRDHLGGSLDPRHVAWILGGLLDLACLLDHFGLVHHDLSLDTVFLDPIQHRVALPGPWWYGTAAGARLRGLPRRSLNLMPLPLREAGLGGPATDLELIRALGRELLGDPTGLDLEDHPGLPKALVAWVLGSTSGAAREDYRAWMQEVLPASFGPRRFVPLEVRAADLYGGAP